MTDPAHTLHRWTRAEYERMVAAGVFHPEARLELLDGEIVEMSPQGSAHATAVQLVQEALRLAFGSGYTVRVQAPIALDGASEPEPDVAVVPGTVRDFSRGHPSTAVLIVEVADTTLRYDRAEKATAYARNAIPEYWVLNLRDRLLEVHRRPHQDTYAERRALAAGEGIAPLSAPTAVVSVADLLP